MEKTMTQQEIKTLRRGQLLMTRLVSTWSPEEIQRSSESEKRLLFSNFSMFDEGRSRTLVCSFNHSHPNYEELAENIPKAYNSIYGAGILPEQVEKMKKALEWAYEEIMMLDKQVPNSMYNQLTEGGKRNWEEHSQGMIKIENALNNK